MLKNNVLHDICSRGKIHFLSHISCVDFDIKLLKIVLPAKKHHKDICLYPSVIYLFTLHISLSISICGEASFQAFTRKSIIKVKKSFPDNPIPAYPVISSTGTYIGCVAVLYSVFSFQLQSADMFHSLRPHKSANLLEVCTGHQLMVGKISTETHVYFHVR